MTQIFYALYRVIDLALMVYIAMIVVYALLSWFPNARFSALGRLIARFVEPFLAIFQRFIPPILGLDFSPLIALFLVQAARSLLTQLFLMMIGGGFIG